MRFESADFRITENHGVISDSFGNKTLDAKVELNEHFGLTKEELI